MAVEIQPPMRIENELDNEKICWICHSSEDDQNGQWIKPCQCRGTMKWVHHDCLLMWVVELREGKIFLKNPKCSLCETKYLLVYPLPIGFTVIQKLLRIEKLNKRIFYLFGFIGVVVQVLVAGPLSLLCCIFLPTRLIKLENKVAYKLADRYTKSFGNKQIRLDQIALADKIYDNGRGLISCLSFPVLSKFIAMLLKSCIASPFRRRFFGIGFIITANSFLGVYLKYEYRRRQMILDYD